MKFEKKKMTLEEVLDFIDNIDDPRLAEEIMKVNAKRIDELEELAKITAGYPKEFS